MSVKADLAHRLADLLAAEYGRARNIAAGKPFSRYQDIRGHVFILTGKHGTCLSDSGYYLIKNEKRAVLIAQFSYTFPESLRRHDNAASRKDRL